MGGEIFRTHPDRPWGPPSLLVSFPGVKQPGRCVDHPPSSVEVKERVELYLYPPPSGPSLACSRVNFTFTIYNIKATNSYCFGSYWPISRKYNNGTKRLLSSSERGLYIDVTSVCVTEQCIASIFSSQLAIRKHYYTVSYELMCCPVGGGLGGVQRRFLSVYHQMSIFVLSACCVAGALVVP